MGNNSKVIGAGIGGAIGMILTWCLTQFGGVEIPNEIAGAITTLCGALVTYFVPPNTT